MRKLLIRLLEWLNEKRLDAVMLSPKEEERMLREFEKFLEEHKVK